MLLCLTFFDAFGQKISTSPTRLNYKVSPGGSSTGLITVTNNADRRQTFTVDFGDFDASRAGKSKFMEKGTLPRSCADWLSATPALFELDPGESQQIRVVMDVPQDSSALVARWAVAYIRLSEEKQSTQENSDGLIVNLNQAYRFGVYIFQTPPNAVFAKGELIDFTQQEDQLVLRLRNVGETFLKCNSYAEFTNLQTGEITRLKPRNFTVLPASNRDVTFIIPKDYPPGRYSVLGVLDYGNRDEVAAAEIEIEIKEKSKE
jgi:P pilus assembly chaperone PapD|tara:strand:+ start:3537 stop:4319 length:783 start_codon:yes stop_codon:yes gene_type:complete